MDEGIFVSLQLHNMRRVGRLVLKLTENNDDVVREA